ncbi:AEC family transporter [Acinetobacter stercoris]|uniref:Putative transporter YfdV n=1 Tax=Acinetobacter stercoris TaxID=2126983 RepID=A0A2U3MY19_9GAMM|nr:AEC family transporter [Acinetobacter stercoris]SPL70253.1 putative transporter YfdV [Acinetobacter stercoris]
MVLTVILPIFMLLFLGYISVRFNLITKDQITALSAFVIKISLPALLLHALASKDLHEIWYPSYFFVYAGVSLLLYFFTLLLYLKFFKNNLTHSAVLAMGGSMSNTGFIGAAILTLLMGTQSTIYISLTLIVENVLIVTLMLAFAEAGLQSHQNIGKLIQETLLKLLKNPVIVSVILGIICAAFGIRLPKLFDQALEMLGKTASPIALFVIGGGLVGLSIQSVSVQSFVLVFLKIIIMPLLVFTGLSMLPNVTTDMLYAGTIIAALPMPAAFGIFGHIYNLNEKTLTPLMMSTFLGFFVVSALIAHWW